MLCNFPATYEYSMAQCNREAFGDGRKTQTRKKVNINCQFTCSPFSTNGIFLFFHTIEFDWTIVYNKGHRI